MRFACLTMMLLLGACHSAQTRDEINAMEANGMLDAPPAATVSAAAPRATAVSIDRKDDLVDFHAGWPSEAAAMPAIDKRLHAEADKALAELVAGAKEDKAMRDKDGLEFHGYTSKIDYQLSGMSDRLLSLDAVFDSYTGGAHGMHGTVALLWDKSLDKEVGFAGLFPAKAAAYAAISKRFCAALDAERAKRRGDFKVEGADDPFNQCPKLDELHVVPTDKDGDGRFETLRVIADPYVAGPWAEGDYEIMLPVTDTMIAGFKPEYRPSFKA